MVNIDMFQSLGHGLQARKINKFLIQIQYIYMYINKHTGNIGILHSITTVVKVNDKDILRVCVKFS